jgi:4-amino-4-deoxy-L-arabinose transferase-like glycosyltransferase
MGNVDFELYEGRNPTARKTKFLRLRFGPLALGLILVLSFYLRLHHLGSRPLYGDEPFFTVEIATRSLSQITTTNLGSTLYPLLVHFLLPLGKTETMARLPAALFGLFSVLAIFLLAKQIFGKKEGLIAALFSSISTYLIFFSQQARGYTGLLLFSVLSLYFFWRALNEGKTHLWLLYTLSTVIGIYFHLILILVIPIHAFFVALLMFHKWAQKKKKREIAFSQRTFWGVVLSIFFILLLTYFLCLPVSKTPGQHTLFFNLNKGFSNILRIEIFRDPIQLMSMVTKRFLAYERWPFFFFIQLALFLFGLISCLRNHRKAAVLFLSYWLLSFMVFIMSNPSAVYLTPPNANKFMMLLPLIFIVMARGLSALHSFLTWTVSKWARVQQSSVLKNALWVVLILGVLFGEGILLETYNLQIWQFYSLKRDSEINAYLDTHISHLEMIYFDDAPNRNDFSFVQPLHYSDPSHRGFMVFEDHVDSFITRDLFRHTGLSVVLNRSTMADNDLPRIKAMFHSESAQELSQCFILHFPSDERTLYEKVVPVLNFLASLPGTDEGRRLECYLLLAKIHLLAQKTDDALRELERSDLLRIRFQARTKNDQKSDSGKKNILMKLSLEKESLSTMLQSMLQQKIEGLLIENADRSSLQGKIDDAIALQIKAERLNPQQSRSFRFHLSLAEFYSIKGLKSEASREFVEALLWRRTPNEEIDVLNRIREIHSLPCGFFIWMTNGICHLRWWSDEKRTFDGAITSSPAIKKVREFRLKPDDKYRLLGNKLKFVGIAHNDRIEGIDLIVKSQTQLSCSFKIDGRQNIRENVLILPGEIHPQRMPFLLKE